MILTVSPTTSSGRTSTSPVWTPARTPKPMLLAWVTISIGSAHGARGGIEGGVEPVADRLDLPAPVARQGGADHRVVLVGEGGPLAVTEPGGLFGRGDDVGEQDGCGDDVTIGSLTAPREELFDLVDERVGVTDEDHVVVAWKLNVPGARNLFGEIAPAPTRMKRFADSMQHERRYREDREQRPHISES